MEPYDTIDSIHEKLAAGDEITQIRHEVATLIKNCLELMRDSLGYWEKHHILYAISALAWNLNPSHQPPTDIWLRLCLLSIEKAFVPEDQRDENYGSKDAKIEGLTYQQLIEALEQAT